ncbi:MAG TPA: S53 family peptidase [Humibacter sp.]|nr:S53 family peptidase [Humibacter sp.]
MNADREDSFSSQPLPGSERGPAPQSRPGETPPRTDRVEATLILRRKRPVPESTFADPVSRGEFDELYGADPDDARVVVDQMKALGCDVLEVDLGRRRVRISAPLQTIGSVFNTKLEWVSSVDHAGNRVEHWQRTGALSLPGPLPERVTAVLGLDDRPQARAHFRVVSAQAVTTSYTPPQLGTIYDFPANTDGSGRTVAIIELGGGFAQADLDAYFAELGLRTPNVTAVGIDGASNQPGSDPNGADGEVLLDIDVVGGLAPAADIVVYFAPNTDAGFVDAISAAAHADPTPDAISISWGQSEDQWTAQARSALDDALVDAAALGVTVTAAAGDDGSTDRQSDGTAHVDFPASSPHALACGGTRLQADPSTGSVSSETVWNDGSGNGATGGGVSDAYPRPSWQGSAGVTGSGRGVPDVAANADPETGYRVRVDGADLVIGGTSAVAPLWAALVARLVQAGGKRVGLLQPKLYSGVEPGALQPGFRDITSGSNGAFAAGPGWDACTGLGVPVGAALLPVVK